MADINFPSSPSGGDTYTYNNITFTYDGEKWTAKAPVTTSNTYGDANVAAYASAQGFIDLADISVSSNSPSGNGGLSYNNSSGVFTFTPADASGSGGSYGDSNVASFLSTNNYSNVAYGNTEVQSYLDAQGYSNVDLDAQTLSIAGNVITISGSGSNVDLTTALGNVSGSGSTTFSALTDTTIANLQTNQVAQWSGSAWVNGYMDMQHISDVDSADTLQDGDIIKYNAPNGQFEFHNLEQEVQGDVDDHLNVSGATSGQVLTWNGSDYAWTAKTVDTDTDAQTLSLAGNVITISGSSSNVDLTTALGNVSGGSSYGDANVASYLNGNLDSHIIPDTNATYDIGSAEKKIRHLYLSPNSLYIGSNVAINTSDTVLQANIDGTVKNIAYEDSTSFQPAESDSAALGTELSLSGGNSTALNSVGGNVTINAGSGALQSGQIYIGTASTTQTNIGANSSTKVNLTGTVQVNNQLVIEDGVSEKFSSLTGATGVVTHDCDNGHIFYHSSISADFTANFTNLGLSTNYGTTLTLVLAQGATAYIPSALQIAGSAQTINWQGGSAPAGTVNGVDAVSFTILRVSGNYVVLGQLVDFT